MKFPACPNYSLSRVKLYVFSGLTVALALVPEAIAFAFVAHVHPLTGLYAAFIVGLITAVLGGRAHHPQQPWLVDFFQNVLI